jgi:hypothetical protein
MTIFKQYSSEWFNWARNGNLRAIFLDNVSTLSQVLFGMPSHINDEVGQRLVINQKAEMETRKSLEYESCTNLLYALTVVAEELVSFGIPVVMTSSCISALDVLSSESKFPKQRRTFSRFIKTPKLKLDGILAFLQQ